MGKEEGHKLLSAQQYSLLVYIVGDTLVLLAQGRHPYRAAWVKAIPTCAANKPMEQESAAVITEGQGKESSSNLKR